MKRLSIVEILILVSLTLVTVTLFVGCEKKEVMKKRQTATYGQVLTVQNGFYQGCSATLKVKTVYRSYIVDLDCNGKHIDLTEIPERDLFGE